MDRILRTGWSSTYIHVPSIADKLDEIVDWINANDEPSGTAGLVWSSEAPTVPGWYWYRVINYVEPIAVLLQRNAKGLYFSSALGSNYTHRCEGEWAGPIPPPSEPRHEGEAIG